MIEGPKDRFEDLRKFASACEADRKSPKDICAMYLDDISWLIAEVERLRNIEDAARGFAGWMDSSEHRHDLEGELGDVLAANPRPAV